MPVSTRRSSKRKASSGGQSAGAGRSRKKAKPAEWSARQVKKWLSAVPLSVNVKDLADAVYKEGIDGEELPYVPWSEFGVEAKEDIYSLEQKISELYGDAAAEAEAEDDVHDEWTLPADDDGSSFMEKAKLLCPMYNDKVAWFLVVAAEVAVLSAVFGAVMSSSGWQQ
uniref:SAM domain-containing protein n=1 Tax=Lotharella oceanica TaxID=641309 RepID=A0A7S2XDD5_9EUKA